jgi:Ca-activated chloride channel homolog
MTGQHPARLAGTAIIALCLVTGLRAQARFSSHSDLVVLHVAVTDRGGHHVPGLTREAFRVFEDGVPQPVTVFNHDDTPATSGLLIDNSASMQGLRAEVALAAGTFVATSHAADEIFALLFNERVQPVLPASVPFTSDADVLRFNLQDAITARGRTALYDAVDEGITYLRSGMHLRKTLVIVSDGGDNASQHTLADLRTAVSASNTVVYAIALRDTDDRDANPGLLKRLAEASGGLCFTARNARRIPEATAAIARDIRTTYTVGYAVPPGPAGVRHLQVNVRDANGPLRARTRREYLVR